MRNATSPVCENHVLDVVDQAVVLGVEDVMDGGQADVLVPAAVAGDVVGVEQLVVVGARGRQRCRRRCRRRASERRRFGAARVRDVVQEGVAGADGVRGRR